MARAIITLTTDFGADSPYIGQMKGAILAVNPAASIVDITHSIPPQDIRYGGLVLRDAWRHFPRETVHIGVVDPGVGTDRHVLCASSCGHLLIAPDNGLLSIVLGEKDSAAVYRLQESRFWAAEVSSTFHGRDLMGPVAAHLTLGVSPQELGPPQPDFLSLELPQPTITGRAMTGEVIAIDGFGNLITNIESPRIAPEIRLGCTIRIGEQEIQAIHQAYGQQTPGTLIALFGSSQRLEVAVVNGSAADFLGAFIGDRVQVVW